MKLNNKGFSMVELLAAVALLAILSGIAISSYSRYQEDARKDAYAAMEKSAFAAAQSYVLDKGIIIPKTPDTKTIEVSTLVEQGYLKKLEDPRVKGSTCHTGSTVQVSKIVSDKNLDENKNKLDVYTFRVIIKCKNYTSQTAGVDGKVFNS